MLPTFGEGPFYHLNFMSPQFHVFLFPLCVHVCCVCTCMCTGTFTHTRTWRPEEDIECPLQTGSLINLELRWLTPNKPQGSFCLYPHNSAGIIGICTKAWMFMWALEIVTRVLIPAQQLSHLPRTTTLGLPSEAYIPSG